MFDVHIHRHNNEFAEILTLLRAILAQGKTMAVSLDALKAQVARDTDVMNSAKILLQGLSQQLKDALANASDQATLQASINDLASQLDSSGTSLADAIVANTPAAPGV